MIEYRGCKIYTKRQTGGAFQGEIELPSRGRRYVEAKTRQSAERKAKAVADEVLNGDQAAAKWFRRALV